MIGGTTCMAHLPGRTLCGVAARSSRRRGQRRGVILAAMLVVLLVVSLIFAALVPELSRARRQARVWQWQQQSRLLAEAAIERARRRLELDSNYAGETWRVPAGCFTDPSALTPGSSEGAEVQIELAAVEGQPQEVSIAVKARFPLDPLRGVTTDLAGVFPRNREVLRR